MLAVSSRRSSPQPAPPSASVTRGSSRGTPEPTGSSSVSSRRHRPARPHRHHRVPLPRKARWPQAPTALPPVSFQSFGHVRGPQTLAKRVWRRTRCWSSRRLSSLVLLPLVGEPPFLKGYSANATHHQFPDFS